MRKGKILIFAMALTAAFSACSAAEMPDNTTEKTITEAASSVLETETSQQEETTASQTEASVTETQTETESSISETESTVSEAETASEETAAEETAPELIPQSRYYEYRLETQNTPFDPEDGSNKQKLEEAFGIAENEQIYKEECDVFMSNDDSSGNFSCELSFVDGITADFDNNGTEESFFILYPTKYPWSYIDGATGPHGYLFYCDDSQVKLITTGYGYYYSDFDLFRRIVYSDFSHLIVSTGDNNATRRMEIYSVNGSDIRLEYRNDILDEYFEGQGITLCCLHSQSDMLTLLLWDDVQKRYIIPEGIMLSEDEIGRVSGLSELVSPDDSVLLVGNMYYSIQNKDGAYGSGNIYKLENDAPVLVSEYRSLLCEAPSSPDEGNASVGAVDLYEAASEMIRLSE